MNQTEALNILKSGRNVFLTGEAGAGKTYVLNQYIDWLQAADIKASVTASTGIAATHIGGLTIHSWSGIGIKDVLTARDLDNITSREKIVTRIDKTKVLVIDEISMLEGGLLEEIDRIVRKIKQTDTAFGGLQVVMVGDFFQLPPVVRGGGPFRFAWESRSWEELDPTVCYLTEQHRHQDDALTDLLRSIRLGELSDDHCRLLSERTECSLTEVEPTRLYTHNIDVDAVNDRRLEDIAGVPRVFNMTTKGNKQLVNGLIKNCLSPEKLGLKIGAVVMCTKNNFEAGYVNGTLAKVTGFDNDLGYPTVTTAAGKKIVIKPTSWELRDDDKVLAEITQLPLRLAWAITIHKSQGMSLDAAEIDLTRAFVYGHGYVALSRVRTLAGLKLIGMNSEALLVNPKVINEDGRFRSLSDDAAAAVKDLSEVEIKALCEQFVSDCGGTMPKLVIDNRVENDKKSSPLPRRKGLTGVENSNQVTLRLLRSGKDLAQIAAERSFALSTILGHVLVLFKSGDLTEQDISNLHSDDTLKPAFLVLREKHGYEAIRLAQQLNRLTESPSSPKHQSSRVERNKQGTLKLLRSGKNLSQIATEQDFTLSTIVAHLERLAESGDLTTEDISHLLPTGWEAIETVISDCLAKQPDDKLKPVFLALGEKYSYDTIRLVRLVQRLSE